MMAWVPVLITETVPFPELATKTRASSGVMPIPLGPAFEGNGMVAITALVVVLITLILSDCVLVMKTLSPVLLWQTPSGFVPTLMVVISVFDGNSTTLTVFD